MIATTQPNCLMSYRNKICICFGGVLFSTGICFYFLNLNSNTLQIQKLSYTIEAGMEEYKPLFTSELNEIIHTLGSDMNNKKSKSLCFERLLEWVESPSDDEPPIGVDLSRGVDSIIISKKTAKNMFLMNWRLRIQAGQCSKDEIIQFVNLILLLIDYKYEFDDARVGRLIYFLCDTRYNYNMNQGRDKQLHDFMASRMFSDIARALILKSNSKIGR